MVRLPDAPDGDSEELEGDEAIVRLPDAPDGGPEASEGGGSLR